MQHRLLYWLVAITFLDLSNGQRVYLNEVLPDQDGRRSILYVFLKTLFGSDAFMVPTAFDEGISTECYQASRHYLHSIKHFDLWALAMEESSGKLADSYLMNNAMGIFDQCLGIDVNTSQVGPFRGKYCSVYFKLEALDGPPASANWLIDAKESDGYFGLINPLSQGLGMCVPSICSAADVRHAVARLVGKVPLSDPSGNRSSVVTITDERYCYSQDDPPREFDASDIAVLVLLSAIGFLIVIATIRDLMQTYFSETPHVKGGSGKAVEALHCFSALTNGRKMLAASAPGVQNFACLNGLRVISTTWVIMGHTYYIFSLTRVANFSAIVKDLFKWDFQTITNAEVSVDTFFLISGTLVGYYLLRELDRNKGRFNIVLFYLHRYLRLTPVYAIILAFLATLVIYVGSGPDWQNIQYSMVEVCRNEWWRNLLYINIYLRSPIGCMGETWFLANDIQLYILSPLFIYPLWRWKKRGVVWVLFSILILLSTGVALWTVYHFPLGMPTRLHDYQGEGDYTHMYYVSPAMRAPNYLLGILLGYLLYITHDKPVKIAKPLVGFLWVVSSAMALAVVYGLVPYIKEENVHEVADPIRVAYGSLSRFAWSVSVSWVIFACIKGYGGFINELLSWSAFGPLSRMTYCAYLIHLNYMKVFFAYMRRPVFYTTLGHITMYFGILMTVFLLSFFISLTIEAPFINLEKLVFTRKKK